MDLNYVPSTPTYEPSLIPTEVQPDDPRFALLDMFAELLTKVREHRRIRAKEGVGTKEEAYAFGLVQQCAKGIERYLQP